MTMAQVWSQPSHWTASTPSCDGRFSSQVLLPDLRQAFSSSHMLGCAVTYLRDDSVAFADGNRVCFSDSKHSAAVPTVPSVGSSAVSAPSLIVIPGMGADVPLGLQPSTTVLQT